MAILKKGLITIVCLLALIQSIDIATRAYSEIKIILSLPLSKGDKVIYYSPWSDNYFYETCKGVVVYYNRDMNEAAVEWTCPGTSKKKLDIVHSYSLRIRNDS